MVSQRRLLNLLTILILLSLFAVACERPLGGTDDPATTDTASEVTDANQGGGTDGGETTTTDETTDSGDTPATDDSSNGENAGDTTTETAEETQDTGEATDDTAADTATEDQASDNTADDTADTSSDTDGAADADAATDDTADDTTESNTQGTDQTSGTIPETHTVAAGENLYRIGLKYGISWVAIANENNLTNPNALTVGQVLKLPGAATPTPEPTPSPQTESTYIVQPGDNLFRIGLKFGISWVQIAEANGLVNPNLITAGDEIKIPVDAPGPAPAFSHVVKQGETLFLISLQYGVAWPTIAEANNLTSPYVIYVGQTLEIPGN